jgi:parallel beta-helix repeat protein
VIYVDKDDADCTNDGGGTRAAPFCVLQDAVDEARDTLKDAILVEAPDAETDYYAPVAMSDAGPVWLVSRTGVAGVKGKDADTPVVFLSGDTQLVLDGIKIYYGLGNGAGIRCVGTTSDPTLTVFGSTITDNAGAGVLVTDCTVTLEGNTLTGNAGGGVSLSSCGFTVTNNFITGNGPTSTIGGVKIDVPGTPQVFQYNTVAGNFVSSGVAGGIRCVDPVEIRNSIVYGNTNDELATDCTPRSCLIEDSSGAVGENNIRGQSPSFVDALNGDYHIEDSPPSICIDAADSDWPTDHDVEGDARPQGGGYDIGADEAG